MALSLIYLAVPCLKVLYPLPYRMVLCFTDILYPATPFKIPA